MDWRMDGMSLSCRVSPFGHLRVTGYLLLTAAFRSLSRPSSALSAKASTLRSFLFDLSALIAFRTDGSLALHLIVFTIWWVVFLIRYPFKITPRMSFPISKRLTFFWIFSYMQFSRYIKMRALEKRFCKGKLACRSIIAFSCIGM